MPRKGVFRGEASGQRSRACPSAAKAAAENGRTPPTATGPATSWPAATTRKEGAHGGTRGSPVVDGEGGIRTLEGGSYPLNALAGRRLQPLGHFSGAGKDTPAEAVFLPAPGAFLVASSARPAVRRSARQNLSGGSTKRRAGMYRQRTR